MNPSTPFSKHQRIANSLLLNASFIDNSGLMHGKMGIAIYFFHLARKTENKMYEDYAGELIDEIYEEIFAGTPIDFENGLAGIGWGVEYLVQNKFIDADTNEVLDEFDNRIIHEMTFHAPPDIGILKGVGGHILYFLSRLKSNEVGTSRFQTIKKTLMDLFVLLQKHINDLRRDIFEDEPDKFDLIWEYPQLLWLLSEIVKAQTDVDAVRLIIQLISPSLNSNQLPKLHSHRLLFALVCEKLQQVKLENLSRLDLEKLGQRLLAGIERDIIALELTDRSVFLRNGTSGIALVYKQLYTLTNRPLFNDESEYWIQFGFNMPESDKGDAGFFLDRKDEKTAYGILNGLAGINLFTHAKS